MRHFHIQIGIVLCALLLVVFASALPVIAEITYQTRALTDDATAAPGTDAGFDGFTAPTINGAGQIAFIGTLTGIDVSNTNKQGIWSDRSGSLKLIVRLGDAAPGMPEGVVFDSFDNPVINGAGQIAFGGRFGGRHVKYRFNGGIWSEGSGSLRLVAHEVAPARGTDGGFTHLYAHAFSDTGQIAFRGEIRTKNKLGHYVKFTGIWSQGSGSLKRVVREGDPAPGTDGVFVSLGDPVINGAGQISFKGTSQGEGADTTGIWSQGPEALKRVPRGEGENVFAPITNGAGQIAYEANHAIWSDTSGSLKTVAQKWGTAPGTDATFNIFSAPVINGAGQIAFYATLNGAKGYSRHGIWATDANGELKLIAQAGNQFDINDDPLIDDFRTIAIIRLLPDSGGKNGRATSFNDAGQLAFSLVFTDVPNDFVYGGAGLFVATIPNSVTAVMDPIQTKPLLTTGDTEGETTQDDTPMSQSQQQQAESDPDDPAGEKEHEAPDEEDSPEKTDVVDKVRDAVKNARGVFDIFRK